MLTEEPSRWRNDRILTITTVFFRCFTGRAWLSEVMLFFKGMTRRRSPRLMKFRWHRGSCLISTDRRTLVFYSLSECPSVNLLLLAKQLRGRIVYTSDELITETVWLSWRQQHWTYQKKLLVHAHSDEGGGGGRAGPHRTRTLYLIQTALAGQNTSCHNDAVISALF